MLYANVDENLTTFKVIVKKYFAYFFFFLGGGHGEPTPITDR